MGYTVSEETLQAAAGLLGFGCQTGPMGGSVIAFGDLGDTAQVEVTALPSYLNVLIRMAPGRDSSTVLSQTRRDAAADAALMAFCGLAMAELTDDQPINLHQALAQTLITQQFTTKLPLHPRLRLQPRVQGQWTQAAMCRQFQPSPKFLGQHVLRAVGLIN